jgi:plasmid stability protein
MSQILVRNVKPEAVRRLKRRARACGRSLQSEAKMILEQAAELESPRVSRKRLIAMLEGFRKRWKGKTFSDSTELIREDRDNR